MEVRKLEKRLEQFLEDLVAPMGRSERRHWACVHGEGLLQDGERKSISDGDDSLGRQTLPRTASPSNALFVFHYGEAEEAGRSRRVNGSTAPGYRERPIAVFSSWNTTPSREYTFLVMTS